MTYWVGPPQHRVHALVHKGALAHNLKRVKRLTPKSKVFAVVKGDAYGHGIENVMDGLREADGFAVLDMHEAMNVRRSAPTAPILLLEGLLHRGELDIADLIQAWHVVHDAEQVAWLVEHRSSVPELFDVRMVGPGPGLPPQRVFIKVNTGMNRFGFKPSKVREVWERLNRLPHVEIAGFMTHFSDADGPRGIDHQIQVFIDATRGLPGERTLSNSAAILRHARSADVHADWVRAGLMLYGSSPDYPQHDAKHWNLQPAMSLRARILAVQELMPGDTVGYGSTFTATKRMRIGIVTCGFADGYPRGCPSGTPVLVDGVMTGSVGSGSMDTLAVDLTHLRRAGLASEVTLWGRSSKGTVLPVEVVASAAGLSGDLTVNITRRVTRMEVP